MAKASLYTPGIEQSFEKTLRLGNSTSAELFSEGKMLRISFLKDIGCVELYRLGLGASPEFIISVECRVSDLLGTCDGRAFQVTSDPDFLLVQPLKGRVWIIVSALQAQANESLLIDATTWNAALERLAGSQGGNADA